MEEALRERAHLDQPEWVDGQAKHAGDHLRVVPARCGSLCTGWKLAHHALYVVDRETRDRNVPEGSLLTSIAASVLIRRSSGALSLMLT